MCMQIIKLGHIHLSGYLNVNDHLGYQLDSAETMPATNSFTILLDHTIKAICFSSLKMVSQLQRTCCGG